MHTLHLKCRKKKIIKSLRLIVVFVVIIFLFAVVFVKCFAGSIPYFLALKVSNAVITQEALRQTCEHPFQCRLDRSTIQVRHWYETLSILSH